MNFKKMAKRFLTLSKAREGFTLVELIVVIAIMAILAGVAVPAYTGYIEKAEKAGDLQLLSAVNTAFAAAAMDEANIAVSAQPDGAYTFNVKNMTPSDYEDTFAVYFKGNDGTFKTIKLLAFKGGVFVEGSSAYAGLVGTFSADDITTFNNSAYSQIGFDALMGKVDMAVQTAMDASDGSTLNTLVMDDANYESLAKYLGFESTESKGFGEAFTELLQTKALMLAPAGTSEEDMYEYYELAEKELLANTAVLVAATNSTFDTDAFKAQLAAGNGKSTIQTSMNTDGGTQEALSQTALAYGMYTSYIQRTGGTASNNITEVLGVLESDGFKNYMNNVDGGDNEADADMKGYLAAMSMINSASSGEDKSAVSSLLVNGFNDADLLALLNQEVSVKQETSN